jgi:5-methylcytosine-specific restriction endonuclease McrA
MAKKRKMSERTKESIRRKILDGTIYKDKRYVEWRKKVFERDRYVCQLSGEVGGWLEAHHIIPKYDYPEGIFDVDNGITLRKQEHQWLHDSCFEKRYEKEFQELAKKNKPKRKIRKNTKIRKRKKE